MRVRSLVSLSRLRIHCFCKLWYHPATAALIQSLGWELPYATGVAIGDKKKPMHMATNYKQQNNEVHDFHSFFKCTPWNDTHVQLTLDQHLFEYPFRLYAELFSGKEIQLVESTDAEELLVWMDFWLCSRSLLIPSLFQDQLYFIYIYLYMCVCEFFSHFF